MKRKLILFLLPLLGFQVACSSDNPNAPDDPNGNLCLYGTPTAQFTIRGRVTDAAGKPVQGIEVTPLEAWHRNVPSDSFIPDNEVERDPVYPQETVSTSATGEYKIEGQCFDWRSYNVTLQVEDTDGPDNGGEFTTAKIDIPITASDCIEQGSRTSIYAKQADNIVIEPKAEE